MKDMSVIDMQLLAGAIGASIGIVILLVAIGCIASLL